MKARVHIFGAIFGSVCALAFVLAPFVAGADAGPAKLTAPVHATPPLDANPTRPIKRHMHRGNVQRRDEGCGN